MNKFLVLLCNKRHRSFSLSRQAIIDLRPCPRRSATTPQAPWKQTSPATSWHEPYCFVERPARYGADWLWCAQKTNSAKPLPEKGRPEQHEAQIAQSLEQKTVRKSLQSLFWDALPRCVPHGVCKLYQSSQESNWTRILQQFIQQRAGVSVLQLWQPLHNLSLWQSLDSSKSD